MRGLQAQGPALSRPRMKALMIKLLAWLKDALQLETAPCFQSSVQISVVLSIVNAALTGSHFISMEEQTYVALIDQKISKAHFL